MENWSKPDFEHKYTRRGHNINYYGPGTWHIVLKKTYEAPDFGTLAGNPAILPGKPGCAHIVMSPIGRIIQKEIHNLERIFDVIQIYQYMLMPDHMHILLRIKYKNDHHLGYYISRLKGSVHTSVTPLMAPEKSEKAIFEDQYTDRIIHSGRSLDAVFKYIRENPHRLAMRKLRPDFFSHMRNIEIAGEQWQAYGNLFLLRNPFKSAVIVRSAFTEEERAQKKSNWLWNAKNGGVLVSPFISTAEKEIRNIAERSGGRMIHIQENPFTDRFKPEAHRFEQCANGNLLIIAPMASMPEERMRDRCLHMNRIAEALCQD